MDKNAENIKNLSLTEFINLLKNSKKKGGIGVPIEELQKLFGVSRSTIFGWARGGTDKIPVNKIREIMSKIQDKYGLKLGRITHSTIEIINVGRDQTATNQSRIGHNNDNVAELGILREEKQILLSKVIELELENRRLKERLGVE